MLKERFGGAVLELRDIRFHIACEDGELEMVEKRLEEGVFIITLIQVASCRFRAQSRQPKPQQEGGPRPLCQLRT